MRVKPDLIGFVNLPPLMKLSRGRPDVTIALVDGPLATFHRDLAGGPFGRSEVERPGRAFRQEAWRVGTALLWSAFVRRARVPGSIRRVQLLDQAMGVYRVRHVLAVSTIHAQDGWMRQ